jgi:hypothetical protein
LGDFTVWIIEFIEQEKVFVEHSLQEQFFLALKSFEAQEAFHATTYEHIEKVKSVFPVLHGREYFKEFDSFKEAFKQRVDDPAIQLSLEESDKFLQSQKIVIDKYSNYLTHTDFVPHNFRIKNNNLYMLDCAPEYRTVHFGNKYEGWARFLNYMVIHNPELDHLLSTYILKNRGEEEYLSLRLMRIYKIGFLLKFYAEALKDTKGDLNILTLERIAFWHKILDFLLKDLPIPAELIQEYKSKRDTLRSPEEKRRQKEFAVS